MSIESAIDDRAGPELYAGGFFWHKRLPVPHLAAVASANRWVKPSDLYGLVMPNAGGWIGPVFIDLGSRGPS